MATSTGTAARPFFHWELGRQGSGYWKMLLGQGSWWDCYLLKYPPGTIIAPHKDPVEGKRHFRLNLVLWGEQTFGSWTWILNWGRLVLFRPDISTHWVNSSERLRLVLSIGWVRPLKAFQAKRRAAPHC